MNLLADHIRETTGRHRQSGADPLLALVIVAVVAMLSLAVLR